MKKFIIYSAILLTSFFFLQSAHAQVAKIKIDVDIDWKIGRPRHNCSPGLGFCIIRVHVHVNLDEGPAGRFQYDPTTGTLDWTVREDQISTSDLSYFSGQSSMTFDEDQDLPADIKNAFGVASTVVIKAGTYSISYANGVYTISSIPVR